MQLFAAHLTRKLIFPTLVFVFASTVSLAVTLMWNSEQQAVAQRQILGNALSLQLAQSAQEPLINHNAISLQVVLDKLVAETPGVTKASVYDAGNHLVVESVRTPQQRLATAAYSSTITIDDTILGSVQIELTKSSQTNRVWLTVGLLLVMGLLFVAWQVSIIPPLVGRISRLGRSLTPVGEEGPQLDELDLLENRIKPFLVHGKAEVTPAQKGCYCLLAMSCANLPRLRIQLNSENFSALLYQLDLSITAACKLYDGERCYSDQHSTYLRFAAVNDESDHILRALSCAGALMKLCAGLAPAQGIPLEMKASLGLLQQDSEAPLWLQEAAERDAFNKLRDRQELASPWETLLDASLLGEAAVMDSIETEPLTTENEILRLLGFMEPQASMLDHQTQYLRSQLPPTVIVEASGLHHPGEQSLH